MTPYILSGHKWNKIRNDKRNYRKYSNTGRLNNLILNAQWVMEEIKGQMKKT
jgi:hypothetical protein